MANFGMLSEWYRNHITQEMDTFRRILKKGDILEMTYRFERSRRNSYYEWAICTQDGPEPKMTHRYNMNYSYEYWLDNKVGFVPEMGSVLEISMAKLGKLSIRINNSRDRVTAPKPLEDIVGCALEAIGTTGDGQFGSYHYRVNNDLDFVERVRYPKDALDKRLDDRCCSPWHTEEGYETFSWLLRPGDMVEFNRKNVYSHWAVVLYRPQDRARPEPLIHRYGSGDAAELVKKLIGTIMTSSFKEVIKGSRFRINNSWDKTYKPIDGANIWEFAIGSVGSNTFGKYNLVSNNCWHFAMQVRYRVKVGWNTNQYRTFNSAQEMRSQLLSGDIIDYSNNPDDRLAIYVERAKSSGSSASDVSTDKTKEVAYLSRPEGPLGKVVVSLISADEFFADVARVIYYRINNQWDRIWKLKDTEDIVKYIVDANGKEDPYFVIGARYGEKAREEARGTGKNMWTAMVKLMHL